MVTQSFLEGLEIRADEAAERLLRVLKNKGNQKPIEDLDVFEELERGRSYFKKRYYL